MAARGGKGNRVRGSRQTIDEAFEAMQEQIQNLTRIFMQTNNGRNHRNGSNHGSDQVRTRMGDIGVQPGVKKIAKTVETNPTVTPKVSGPAGTARKRMEVNSSSDFCKTLIKPTAKKASFSKLAPVVRRNNTEGLPDKQPSSIIQRQTDGNPVASKKTSPLASDSLRQSPPEFRGSSLPSVPTNSLILSIISETRSVASSSLERTASSATRKPVPMVSFPSVQAASVSNGSNRSLLPTLVKMSFSLSGRPKVASPESWDSRFNALPKVKIKACDDGRLDLREHQIQILNFSGMDVSRTLKFVYLGNTLLFTVEGAEILKRMKALSSFNDFKGPGFEILANSKAIRQLYFAGNQITSLMNLPVFPNLAFLSVVQDKLKLFLVEMPHLEAASILLVGPTLEKVNDLDLSREEKAAHTAFCIREGMFICKAKGNEWSLDNNTASSAVLVAREAHAITLAIEGLLGVVFTVATLTNEVVDIGELKSLSCDSDPPTKCYGKTAVLFLSMVDLTWLTTLKALSPVLTKSHGEAVVLEILKGYQVFTQAFGVLHAVEPLNSFFLASLSKCTINIRLNSDKRSTSQSPGSERSEHLVDQRDGLVLTPKDVQALRTFLIIAHKLSNVLGPSWVLVLETLTTLDRAIHSLHAATQKTSTVVLKFTGESSSQCSDCSKLSSLNSPLFKSPTLMEISIVKPFLSTLCQLSHQCVTEVVSGFGQASSQEIGSISILVDRILSVLLNNLHSGEPLWNQVVGRFLKLVDDYGQHLSHRAFDALDQSICAVLGSDHFQENEAFRLHSKACDMEALHTELRSLECDVASPLRVLYFSMRSNDVCAEAVKILPRVLQMHEKRVHYNWPSILGTMRSVAGEADKDTIKIVIQVREMKTRAGDYFRFLVKWAGQPDFENSWITEAEFLRIDPDLCHATKMATRTEESSF